MRVGYKVTCLVNGHNYSAVYRGTEEVEYQRYEWAVPNEGCGPLCVFENMMDAIELVTGFGQAGSNLHIWKCKYVPSLRRKVWCPGDGFYHEGNITRRRGLLLEGTRLASKVMITMPLVKREDGIWKEGLI